MSYILYQMHLSGNCYKVRLVLHQLGLPYQLVEIDLQKGETREQEFLRKNPIGKTPTLELPDGRFLAESNAITFYLAEGSPLIPAERYDRADMLRWQFFEQYSHEPYIAVARSWMKFIEGGAEAKKDEFAGWHKKGYQALDVMEKHLGIHDFFAANQYSLADISLYAYSHVAQEGGFDLSPYKNIRAWFARVENQPDYIAIDWHKEE